MPHNNIHGEFKLGMNIKDKQFIQYGCGHSAPANWRNFDSSPTLRVERLPLIGKAVKKNASRFPDNVEFGDVVKGLPLANDSCMGVYCSHILEHLSLEDFRVALVNTKKVLNNNGCFRLVLPDFEYSIKKYLESTDSDASIQMLKETALGRVKRHRGIIAYMQDWLGNSQHLWMWDYKSLKQELEKAGFSNIRRAQYGDAADSKFLEVENKDRWENCLGIECFKLR